MTEERDIAVNDMVYCVVISDERKALLAAKAAGRVFVGLLEKGSKENLWEAEYLVESLEAADDAYLERVVRRSQNLPWIIAESKRLCIREFTAEDAMQIPVESAECTGVSLREELMPEDEVFCTREKLDAYIRGQYRFYEYGIWAVVRKSDGVIVGKAGVSDLDMRAWGMDKTQMQLGYHIFQPYRRQGYAEEACRLILDYVNFEYGDDGLEADTLEAESGESDHRLYAVVDEENTASTRLLCKLGFQLMAETDNESTARRCLYSRCLR